VPRITVPKITVPKITVRRITVPKIASGGGRQPAPGSPDVGLHALESRLDRLEDDVATVLAGGTLPAAPPSRAARLAQVLVALGVLLIVAALALAVF
jgi:hypothetical protein